MKVASSSKKASKVTAVVIHYPHIHEMLGVLEKHEVSREEFIHWLAMTLDETLLLPYRHSYRQRRRQKNTDLNKLLEKYYSYIFQLSRATIPAELYGDVEISHILLRKDGSTVIFIE